MTPMIRKAAKSKRAIVTDALSTDSKGSSVAIPRKDQERCFTTFHQLTDDNKRVFYKMFIFGAELQAVAIGAIIVPFFLCEFSHTAPEFLHRSLEVTALYKSIVMAQEACEK